MTFEEFKGWTPVPFPLAEDSLPKEPGLYAWFLGETPFWVGQTDNVWRRTSQDQRAKCKNGADRRNWFKNCDTDYDVGTTVEYLSTNGDGQPITLKFIQNAGTESEREKEEEKIIRSLLLKRIILLNFLTGCCRTETEEEEREALRRFCEMLCGRGARCPTSLLPT